MFEQEHRSMDQRGGLPATSSRHNLNISMERRNRNRLLWIGQVEIRAGFAQVGGDPFAGECCFRLQ